MCSMSKRLGIYVHIPFCIQKCNYCDFCSVTDLSEELALAYTERLCRDVRARAELLRGRTVDTIYFGGGTPTLLPTACLSRIMDTVTHIFSVDGTAEITIEANPATADAEKLSALRCMGFNRLSLGLQSASDEELRLLGRVHSYEDFKHTYTDARRAGFGNISADLMFGIPTQTLSSFDDTLHALISLSPEHISAYGLTVEPNTPFGRMGASLSLPNDDMQCDMYHLCGERLREAGYERYEISNYAKEGFASHHNLRYWLGEEYLGLGVAAHSFVNGERFGNSRALGDYLDGREIEEERHSLTPSEAQAEYVMLRMRLCEGVSHQDFFNRFRLSFESQYKKRLSPYIAQGFVIQDDRHTAFTEKGFLISNTVLADILDF